MLPTFVVIGAKKGGTTSLHRYLAAHPDVWVPEQKRLEFFSVHWDRGVSWYEAQFHAAGSAPARGEVSTSYTRYPVAPDVPERMHATVPDVRLVYLVRHPIERIVSHFKHGLAEGWAHGTIDEAVRSNPAEFVAPSRYAFQLERYLALFPREQLLVVTSEDLRDDRLSTLAAVFSFIGVDPSFEPGTASTDFHRSSDIRAAGRGVQRVRHSAPYRAVRRLLPGAVRARAWRAVSRPREIEPSRSELSDETRAELLERIRPDLVALRRIVGPEFHGWGLLD